MNVLLVEDDAEQAEVITTVLTQAKINVHHVDTESAFRAHWASPTRPHYDAAVLDLMVRWTRPRQGASTRPPEVVDGGLAAAGHRCAELILADSPRTRILVFTVLEQHEVPLPPALEKHGVSRMTKGDELKSLVTWLRAPRRGRARA